MVLSPPTNEVQQNSYIVASYPVEIQVTATKTDKIENHRNVILKSESSKLGYNCVTYARSKAQVPNGVGSLRQKQKQINTNTPSVGSVGITAEGSVGHLVIIEEIKDDTLIISEGNYRRGYITWREIPKSIVLGYIGA